ncbi:FIST signal transduction protein [Aquabacterium sp.]|uniref:FIST signal transduction protein n=1 Tax=Aquabacterium sp. TaxID=1872578 RepID=UPI002E2EEFB5|nr:FIST N-terminal domain-containing protein [Aquabacterium sp.]HEX5311484.1 FIST N-terminal domain-containing protein [Aquabacterium sp.]
MHHPPLQFLHAHATHPQADMAVRLVWAQLASRGVEAMGPTLGWCYLTDELAPQAKAVLHALRQHLPHVAWVGASGVGVLATGVEYFDEPALAVMVCNLPRQEFQIFNGCQPLKEQSAQGFVPHSALVHADSQVPDLPDLLQELADRTRSGYLFGGITVGRHAAVHLAVDPLRPLPAEHTGVWEGGLSGVSFSAQAQLVSRMTQGCIPIGPSREITDADRNVVYELDGQPALGCLLQDLNLLADLSTEGWEREAIPRIRNTLVGLTDADSDLMAHGQHFGGDTRVRHLIGLDPNRHGVAMGELVEPGMRMAFCKRNVNAARQDLIRMAAEVREEFDPQDQAEQDGPAGGLYISCAGRGGQHFGGPHAEMALLAHAMGEIPMVGFFAGGEIARHHLFGYTGILTVWG